MALDFPSPLRASAAAFLACQLSLIAVSAALFLAPPLQAAEKLQFNRDIRPILSDKCFFCHGPDSNKREADLRLDMGDSAFKSKAIVPGKPEQSEIIARILTHDADDQMPPVQSKLPTITPDEVAKLKQWIREGATYEAHWSFIPLKLDAFQSLQKSVPSPIAELVRQGLTPRGLKLQAEASAETLIRRLSFDLTGLPPDPKAVTDFTAAWTNEATRPQTYEALVNTLLASPAYGERMAVDWLDMARYADSYGFQVDRDREVWMWRDWVIKAFNENLPFDRFITWQVAGDMLPNATDEQILATAFNRLHQQESEGGSVEEEYRVEYVVDRVQTFATAFLGLTFECSRCHDHKYDPITQKEYFGMFSLFQNIDEAGLYSYFTPSVPTPALSLMEPSAKEKLAALKAHVAELEKQISSKPLSSPDLNGAEVAHYTFDVLDKTRLEDALHPTPPPQSTPAPTTVAAPGADAAPPPPPTAPKQPEMAAILKGENKLVPGKLGNALEFTGDDSVDTPVGNFHSYEPFSISLWLKTPDVKDRAVVLHRSRAWTDAGSRGYELLIEEGRLKWSLVHFWPGDAISIRAQKALPLNEWTHVVVTNDGSNRASGLRLYVNGELASVDILRDHLTKDITGGGGDTIALGERFRDRGFKGGAIDDLRIFARDVSTAADAIPEPLLKDLQAARAAVTDLMATQKEIMVMKELPEPKKAYVLFRGEYDKRAAEAPPVTPAFLSPFPAGAPMNRLGLAQWLIAPNHPLTARVTVNRLWQSLFGRGLVKTSEDFGSQGERPLYPELLDYLAVKFIQSGWDVKALIKEMVMSPVYRQQSIADAQTMADDPENQWLARGPRFRLPAEMIRDSALSASGLIDLGMGGPPVNPYEMQEAFKPVAPSGGSGVYRRSLYTAWRRTSPPPAMVAFDAPRRAVCSAKRERTDSPLQALILLNGEQYVEAARVLGERLHLDAKGNLPQMIDQGFLRCLSRLPDERERQIVSQLYQEQLAHFRTAPQEAEQLFKIGTAKHDSSIPPAEAAAATVLAQALLNHDACVVKR